MNETDAARDFSCCAVVPWLRVAEAVLRFLGLVGTGLVLQGCTRAQGAVCGVWRRVFMRHVDTRVCLSTCVWGGEFQDGVVCEKGSRGHGLHMSGKGCAFLESVAE